MFCLWTNPSTNTYAFATTWQQSMSYLLPTRVPLYLTVGRKYCCIFSMSLLITCYTSSLFSLFNVYYLWFSIFKCAWVKQRKTWSFLRFESRKGCPVSGNRIALSSNTVKFLRQQSRHLRERYWRLRRCDLSFQHKESPFQVIELSF